MHNFQTVKQMLAPDCVQTKMLCIKIPLRRFPCFSFWVDSIFFSGKSRYPRAFPPVLENVCLAFSPDSTDCHWVSEEERNQAHLKYFKNSKIYNSSDRLVPV